MITTGADEFLTYISKRNGLTLSGAASMLLMELSRGNLELLQLLSEQFKDQEVRGQF